MEIGKLIDALRVCADDDIICPACERYDKIGIIGGTADCVSKLLLEAAAGLEEQRKRIAELEEQRRWIPVAERLPDHSENVLVCVTDSFGNVVPEDAYLLAQYIAGDGWILEMWPEIEGPNVTHWMPLPELPKEES